jgi:hypothetical protein
MELKITGFNQIFQHHTKCCTMLFLLFLASCDGLVEIVDKEKIPDIASKLVVESYISPQSPTIEVKVTESLPLYGEFKIDPVYIKNAVVILSGESGQQVTIPYDDSTSRYVIDSSAFRVESGKTYRLTVSDENRHVTAQTRVPDKVAILKSYRIDTVPGEFKPLQAARLRCSWDDIRGEDNFYSVRGYGITLETSVVTDPKTGVSNTYQQTSFHTLYDFLKDIIILSDKNQDGLTLTAPQSIIPLGMQYSGIGINENGDTTQFSTESKIQELHIEILNLNESYYRFYQTLRDSDDRGNPFAEPLLIYNNIEGGLGCFGAYTTGISKVTF